MEKNPLEKKALQKSNVGFEQNGVKRDSNFVLAKRVKAGYDG